MVIRIDPSVSVEQLIRAACEGEEGPFGRPAMEARARWLEGVASTRQLPQQKFQALFGALASIGVRVEVV